MKKKVQLFLSFQCSFVLLSILFQACFDAGKKIDEYAISEKEEAAESYIPKIGDGYVLSEIPETPGYPEGIAISRGKIYITSQAAYGTAGKGPSIIYVYNRFTGKLLSEIVVKNEILEEEHGLSGIALDYFDRLYVISTQLGVLRFHKNLRSEYVQTRWAKPIPDIDVNDPVYPFPNDLVFDAKGNLYITDTLQGIIWKVPYKGGCPVIWFESSELKVYTENQMGPNGIRLSPGRKYLYFVFTGSLPGDTMEREGKIYRLPFVDNPVNSDLEVVYSYPAFQNPDGIAFDRFGRLFVVMAVSNEISILKINSPDAASLTQVKEVMRLSGPAGSNIPYMQPSSIAFPPGFPGYAYVVNHALFAPPPPNFFSILAVYVGVGGSPLEKPFLVQKNNFSTKK